MAIEDHRIRKCSWCTGYGRWYTSSSKEFKITGTYPLSVVDVANPAEKGWRVDTYIIGRSGE